MPDAPAGVIVGGWSYAIAAYSITAIGLILYTWSLVARLKNAQLSKDPSEDT